MTIRKLHNSWWVDFRIAGRRRRRRSPENSPAGARAYEKLLREKLIRGEPLKDVPPPPVVTLADFAREWLDVYVRVNNKPSEQRGKAAILRQHLLPVFGTMALSEIGPAAIERFKASRLDLGLSPKTINNHLTVLHKCLQTAADWGRLSVVPRVVWLRHFPPRRDFLTVEESTRLTLAAADEPMWSAMILLGLRTGMRLGELFGLDWQDVDLERHVIVVRRSIVEGIVSSPKTHRERWVAFPFSVRDALVRLGAGTGLIFQRSDGRPLSHGIAENALHRFCDRAGLRRFGWHTLRHTCASQLAVLRGNLLEAQRLLGHTSIAMTERYTHIVPAVLHDAVATLDEAARLAQSGHQVGNNLLLKVAHATTR